MAHVTMGAKQNAEQNVNKNKLSRAQSLGYA